MNLRATLALAGAAVAAATSVAIAAPANASTGTWVGDGPNGQTGMCFDVVCLYYNSVEYHYGAIWESNATEVPDLAGYYFSQNPTASAYGGNPNAGAGVAVKNHAASVEDHSYFGLTDFIYYNSSNYGWGNYNYLYPGQSGDLRAGLKNEDAAFSTNLH